MTTPNTETAQTTPFDDLLTRASTANMNTYADFLTELSIYTVSGEISNVQKDSIVSAIAKQLSGVTATALKAELRNYEAVVRQQERDMVTDGIRAEGGVFRIAHDGVYFVSGSAEQKISSPLRVLAETRDTEKRNWGKLLEWNDREGNQHRWAMPAKALRGEGGDVLDELLDAGLKVVHGKDKKLLEYITCCDGLPIKTCTDRTGWHGSTYVTPDRNYGAGADDTVFQGMLVNTAIKQKGTLAGWQQQIARHAIGNSRAVLAISAAFAGSLIELAGVESGGCQLTGETKDGKTTVVKMGASVHGVPDNYKRLWNNTANALESVAAMHNDGFLFLDELKQCPANKVGDVIYAIVNGQERGRLKKSTALRHSKTWKMLFISTGELSLPAYVEQSGGNVFGGQIMRILDIPSDAGQGVKVLDTLGEFTSLPAFFTHINHAFGEQYGTAGVAWLEAITQDTESLTVEVRTMLNQIKGQLAPNNTDSQIDVAATRFGLIAAAGELATRYGITGWSEGEAIAGVTRCFNDWRVGFGVEEGQSLEHLKIQTAIEAYIDRNQGSFYNARKAGNSPILGKIAGYYWQPAPDSGREYWLLAEDMGDIAGASGKAVGSALKAAKWSEHNTSVSRRVWGKTTKVFVIRFPDSQQTAHTTDDDNLTDSDIGF